MKSSNNGHDIMIKYIDIFVNSINDDKIIEHKPTNI